VQRHRRRFECDNLGRSRPAGRVLALAAFAAALVVSLPAVSAAPAGCDPTTPDTCTLRELGDRLGIRIGAATDTNELAIPAIAGTLGREFNSLTPGNAMKMYTTQPTRGGWNWADADEDVEFAVAHGMEVRGHNLVWAQDEYTPQWVKDITDPAELRAVLDEHITTTIARYKDRVHRWDVINEPLDYTNLQGGLSDNVFARVLGPGWMAEVFTIAHRADPTAELWINEWGTDFLPGRHQALVALVAELRAAGVPIDGVGIQTHRYFGPNGPTQDGFERTLLDYTELRVDVAITELDIPIDPADPDGLTRQADAYRRIVTACVRVERCREITTWGLTDAFTWLNGYVIPFLGPLPTPTRPLLFDENCQPKPAYFAVRDVFAAALLAPPTTTASTPAGPTTTATTAPLAPRPSAADAVSAAPHFTG
jgi:endo-1,4-beta-xylanase